MPKRNSARACPEQRISFANESLAPTDNTGTAFTLPVTKSRLLLAVSGYFPG